MVMDGLGTELGNKVVDLLTWLFCEIGYGSLKWFHDPPHWHMYYETMINILSFFYAPTISNHDDKSCEHVQTHIKAAMQYSKH